MNQYLLLLHENPADFAELSPAQAKEVTERYKSWARSMAERGLLAGGDKLSDDGGRHLKLSNERPLASDGPYAEAHDVIGGYFIIKAESDAQAEQLSTSCPHLVARSWIEIRRIDPMV